MRFLRIGKLLGLIVVVMGLFVLATPPTKTIQENNQDVYILDTANSKVHWKCGHFGYLKFKKGTLVVAKDSLVAAKFTVDMASVKNTDIENELLQGTLQNVLKSIEFFNTAVFPESYFELDNVTRIKDNKYKFSGDFIILNIGICNDFIGTIDFKNDSLYLKTEIIKIDRTGWGIFYGSANNPRPKDEEDGFVVTDTIILDAHIQAYKKLN